MHYTVWTPEKPSQNYQESVQTSFQNVHALLQMKCTFTTSVLHRYSQKLLDFVHQSGGSADSCSSATIRLGKMSSMVEEQLCSRSGSEGTHGSCSVGRNGGDCPDLAELECLVELEWRQVVVFFMLRQALAPCVERLLLLDRTFFLLEQGKGSSSTLEIMCAKLAYS